ncbi:MAG: cupin domain-containing protein [Planctomycetota bacterium]
MLHHASPTDADFESADDLPGISIAMLREDDETGGFEALIRFDAGAVIPAHTHTHADEAILVLEGGFVVDGQTHRPGAYFYVPKGVVHSASSPGGCTIFVRFTAEFDSVPAP